MNVMMNFGWAGIMLLLGVLLRAKISVFQKMLVPASVIAGLLGIIFMNLNLDIGADASTYTSIVNELFTVSFISIGLTDIDKNSTEQRKTKSIMRGCFGMGLVWCILYAITPVLGAVIIGVVGKYVTMDSIYGTMIPFAFTQGPGQAAAFGALYEGYGWENAAMLGVTFAAMGFLASFLIGVPIAKIGITRKIAKNMGKIDKPISRGYYYKEEQSEYMGMDTVYSGNLETLTFHFGLIALCYVLAVGVSKVFAFIPGFFGTSLSGMLFMNGMITSNLVRWIMNKLHLSFLKDSTLQRKITGWTADLLVVCSFMAVEVKVIGYWLLPIMAEVLIITLVTLGICLYFGRRFGDENDFERTLGLYGTSTGTVPSGIALVRIVDPALKTTTAIELGMMNYVMLFCVPIYMVLLGTAAGNLSIKMMSVILLTLAFVYLMILKIIHAWGKPTYSFSRRKNADDIL